MSRLLDAVRVRALTARHRGDSVHCPVCDHRCDRFKEDWNRPDALCWRCGAQERHRAQWLLFERRRADVYQMTDPLTMQLPVH